MTLNKKLSLLAVLSLLLCIISFLPFVSEKSAPKSFQSALLNPSYREEVTEIIISSGGNALSLRKHEKGWIVNSENLAIQAEQKLIKNLLDNAIKVRKMYKIVDSIKGKETYSSQSVSLQFRNNIKVYTKIDIFSLNSLTNRLSFSVHGKDFLYETADDFSQYLQTNVSFWANPSLVQLISSPFSIVWQEKGEKICRFNENSNDFSKKVHDLLLLRHGAILPAEPDQSLPEKFSSLTLSDPEGNSEFISFIPAGDGSFRCQYRWNFNASSATGGTEKVFADSLHFAFEISGWTFDRLKEIFTKG